MPINPTFFDIGREVLGPSIGDQTPERGRLAALARDRSLFYFAPSLGTLVTRPTSDYTWADGNDIPLHDRLSDAYIEDFEHFPDSRKRSELLLIYEDFLALDLNENDPNLIHCLAVFNNLNFIRLSQKGTVSHV